LERNPHLAEAARCMEAHDFTGAEEHLVAALEEADRGPAPAAQRIRVRIELAGAQRLAALNASPDPDMNRLEAALRTICEAIEIAARGSETKSYVECLDTQAAILQDMQQWAALESVQLDAIRLITAQSNHSPAALSARLRALAATQGRLGRPQEALSSYDRALQLHDQVYGPSSPETVELLGEIAGYLRAQRASARAVPYLKRVLQVQEAQYGADSPQALQATETLAAAFEASGNLSLAAQQYERALQMKLRKLGVGNLDEIAEMQYGLAQRHIGWNNLTRARELLSECIGGFQRRGGPRLATALETLAQVECHSGHYSSAVHELERSAQAWERCGPAHIADLVRTLEQRAALLEQMHRERDAQWIRERVAQLTGVPRAPVVRKLVRPA
jgi:hypothetical protein